MATIFKKAMSLIVGNSQKTDRPLRTLTERELIQLESEIGRELFGPIPEGHRREFFCLDDHTWVWHEEWTEKGKHHSTTTRYEVHPNGILKVNDSGTYGFIDGDELKNLAVASRLYYEKVTREVYKRDPHTGLPLAQAPDIITAA
ncbi:MAG TPA: hypothetical protein VD907_01560 [Verrucomicrobiae bacterium]|nr:hypothetical protein [Verrucomicrobiae bacterium]